MGEGLEAAVDRALFRAPYGAGIVPALVVLSDMAATGVLEVRSGDVRTDIYFERGRPVFAEEGSLGETLGRILLRSGRITEEQYLHIIKSMTERIFESEQMRFGEVAVALGYLGPEDVYEGLRLQVERRVIHAMRFTQLEVRFVDSTEPLQGISRFPVSLPDVILRGIRASFDEPRCRALLEGFGDLRPAITHSGELDGLKLTPAELRRVRAIDGTRSYRELLALEPRDRIELQLLAALSLLGTFSSQRAPSAPIETAPSTDSVVDHDAVSRARQRAKELAKGIRQLKAQLKEAPEGAAKRARLEAEAAYRRGLQQFRYDAYAPAAAEFREAAAKHPEELEYALCAGFCEFSMPSGAQPKPSRSELLDLAKRVLASDDQRAFAHYVRGKIALLDGDDRVAKSAFARATRLDPTLVDAVRCLRLLESRKG